MSLTAAIVLAHQGGWDEILFILGPIALVVGLLALAKRRVDRIAAAAPDGELDGELDEGEPERGRGPVSGTGDARSTHPPT